MGKFGPTFTVDRQNKTVKGNKGTAELEAGVKWADLPGKGYRPTVYARYNKILGPNGESRTDTNKHAWSASSPDNSVKIGDRISPSGAQARGMQFELSKTAGDKMPATVAFKLTGEFRDDIVDIPLKESFTVKVPSFEPPLGALTTATSASQSEQLERIEKELKAIRAKLG